MEKVRITEFADPVCTWCWGASAILRAIEYRYDGQIEIDYSMSVMIDDIRTFSDRRLQIGGDDIEMSNRKILSHWLDASTLHGMPVEEHGFHLFDNEHRSTMPQCRAYITAKMYDTKHPSNRKGAKHYFRHIQESTACNAMKTGNNDVLADIAATVGYEPAKFKVMMRSEDVARQLEKERASAIRYDIKSTPTFIISFKENERKAEGYTTCEKLENIITEITDGKVTPRRIERLVPTQENILKFIECHKDVYPVEIAATFGLKRKYGHSSLNIESYELLPDIIEELIKEKEITITPKANSFKIICCNKHRSSTQEKEHNYVGYF